MIKRKFSIKKPDHLSEEEWQNNIHKEDMLNIRHSIFTNFELLKPTYDRKTIATLKILSDLIDEEIDWIINNNFEGNWYEEWLKRELLWYVYDTKYWSKIFDIYADILKLELRTFKTDSHEN